jgi:hypothetical protein
MASGLGTRSYGPFHRLRNPVTQSDAIADRQQQSQELWGARLDGAACFR